MNDSFWEYPTLVYTVSNRLLLGQLYLLFLVCIVDLLHQIHHVYPNNPRMSIIDNKVFVEHSISILAYAKDLLIHREKRILRTNIHWKTRQINKFVNLYRVKIPSILEEKQRQLAVVLMVIYIDTNNSKMAYNQDPMDLNKPLHND